MKLERLISLLVICHTYWLSSQCVLIQTAKRSFYAIMPMRMRKRVLLILFLKMTIQLSFHYVTIAFRTIELSPSSSLPRKVTSLADLGAAARAMTKSGDGGGKRASSSTREGGGIPRPSALGGGGGGGSPSKLAVRTSTKVTINPSPVTIPAAAGAGGKQALSRTVSGDAAAASAAKEGGGKMDPSRLAYPRGGQRTLVNDKLYPRWTFGQSIKENSFLYSTISNLNFHTIIWTTEQRKLF